MHIVELLLNEILCSSLKVNEDRCWVQDDPKSQCCLSDVLPYTNVCGLILLLQQSIQAWHHSTIN